MSSEAKPTPEEVAKAVAEREFIDKLAADLVGQLGPQLAALGFGSPVMLFGLSVAAKVVEETLRAELETMKRREPEKAAEHEAQWVLLLQIREAHEQRAAEEVRKAAAEEKTT